VSAFFVVGGSRDRLPWVQKGRDGIAG